MKKERIPVIKEVYNKGNVFFSEMKKKSDTGIYDKRRIETYLGSKVHFMQSLASNRLDTDGFTLFTDTLRIISDFKLTEKMPSSLTKVAFKSELISVKFRGNQQSILQISDAFYIDGYGNFTPSRAILFKGAMGAQRIGDLLPLDYTRAKSL